MHVDQYGCVKSCNILQFIMISGLRSVTVLLHCYFDLTLIFLVVLVSMVHVLTCRTTAQMVKSLIAVMAKIAAGTSHAFFWPSAFRLNFNRPKHQSPLSSRSLTTVGVVNFLRPILVVASLHSCHRSPLDILCVVIELF